MLTLNTWRPLLALTLAAGTAAAQTPAPTTPHNAQTKRSHQQGATDTDYAAQYAATITPEMLKKDLAVLASDEYEGRETGTKGQQLAAGYLTKALASAGLSGPVPGGTNPYLQPVSVQRTGLDPASTIVVGGRTFVLNKDFYVRLQNRATAVGTVQPAFVGYGISTPSYADFAPGAAELQGKTVLMLLGEPHGPAGQPLLGQGGQPSVFSKVGYDEMTARSPSLRSLAPVASIRIAPTAAAFAQVPQLYAGSFNQSRIELAGALATAPAGVNIFIVSPEMGAALLGTTPAGLAAYEQAVAATGKPVPSPFKPASMVLHVQEKAVPLPTENVLGYLEGTDKKDEVVVVSAHYDHEGVQNGQVYNGADDDGSGTVSVLAFARAFAQAKRAGHGPRRSLLFLLNTAEERGLLGSQYYTDHPLFPLANTVADLNLDMVGRVDSLHQGRGDYLYVIGSDRLSQELHQLSEAANQRGTHPLALDYRYNDPADPNHLYYRSDQYNFARHKIPYLYYFSGFHRDYHRPTDDVAKIDFGAMTRRDQLIFRTAWALANRPARPALDAHFHSTVYQHLAVDLDRYLGAYTSPQLPLKLTFSRDGQHLRALADGWRPLALEATRSGCFIDPAGAILEFDATGATFTLRQSGRRYAFARQPPGS